MSKNNLIRKSDKKFIRLEKARIRKQFSDLVKQEELIVELYKRFSPMVPKEAKAVEVKKEAPKKEAAPKAKAEKKPAKKVVKAK